VPDFVSWGPVARSGGDFKKGGEVESHSQGKRGQDPAVRRQGHSSCSDVNSTSKTHGGGVSCRGERASRGVSHSGGKTFT